MLAPDERSLPDSLLIIDTATERAQIVVLQQGTQIVHAFEPGWHGARHLFCVLQRMCIKPQAVAVTVGPGSYTGIRIGMAAAFGLACGGELPVVGLCALSSFVSPEQGRFLSLIDARGGGLYMMLQERRGQDIIPLTQPQRCDLAELPMHLHGVRAVVGPHLARVDILHHYEQHADPAQLIQAAKRALQHALPSYPSPLYTLPATKT